MDRLSIEAAREAVEAARDRVHVANQDYIKACMALSTANLEHARANPHPWMGMAVYRIMGGGELKTRSEHGRVCFKDRGSDDYGNPHIPIGAYYVLIDNRRAAWLDESWLLELL